MVFPPGYLFKPDIAPGISIFILFSERADTNQFYNWKVIMKKNLGSIWN